MSMGAESGFFESGNFGVPNSNGSEILKKLHAEFLAIRYAGYKLEHIAAILIHTDDLRALLDMMYSPSGCGIGDDISTGTHHNREGFFFRGIKIIDNQFVERGSVYKIFKDGQMPTMMQPHALDMIPSLPPLPRTEPARPKPNDNDQEPPRKVQL